MKKETTFNHGHYDPAHVAALAQWVGMSEEDVRGIIIEVPETKTLYKFFVRLDGIEHYLDSGWFASDQEAEAYVKQAHPRAYARGVEMRAFDRARAALARGEETSK